MSAQTKFTPGPWELIVPADGLWPPRVFAGSKFIGMINNSDDTQAQRIADAHLIAAAPDMFAALEGALEWMSCVEGHLRDGEPFKRNLAEYRAALAKARGQA